MAKTNKEFRSDLAKEMRDKYNERNEELDRIEKSSYSKGLKEQMRKELMDNFYAEIDEMKKRPGYEEARKTHLEEIKAKSGVRKAKTAKEKLLKEYEEKLAKADADISDSKKSYEEAQIAHRGKVEDDLENSEDMEIPQELKDFREAWKEKIHGIDEETKDKIIKSAEKIPVKVETDSDGSRLIEFKLGDKTRKILDPKLENYSKGFRFYKGKDSINKLYDYNYVTLGGMRGDVDDWDNTELSNYVKKKDKEGLNIPVEEQIKEILSSLGKKAKLDHEADQIAMFMYLTGMNGFYWLKDTSGESRFTFYCLDDYREFNRFYDNYDCASLCMIACE